MDVVSSTVEVEVRVNIANAYTAIGDVLAWRFSGFGRSALVWFLVSSWTARSFEVVTAPFLGSSLIRIEVY